MRYLYLFILLSFLLGSCVPSYLVTRPQLVYNFNRGSHPPFNERASAEVEEIIYTEFNYRVNPAVELNQDLTSIYGNVPANIKLVKVQKDSKEAYASISLSGRSITYLSDNDNNGKFDHIMVQARKNPTNWKALKPEVPYKHVEGIKAETGGFEMELIYQGKKENTITLAYQEYQEDLTRAAVTERISFTLQDNERDTMAFRGAKIEIWDATSNIITYKVLTGFDKED